MILNPCCPNQVMKSWVQLVNSLYFVSNKSDESRTHSDELRVSLNNVSHSDILYFPVDEGVQTILEDMSYDTIAQCWFRYLHIINKPVDLCHPEIIGNTPKFRQQALPGNGVVDPLQHECLNKLPYIFFRAMRGISIMVNAFLGRYCIW